MTNDLEIRHCRVLVAVADHGSISSAARALGLAQSTISETLLSLERLLGVPVTVRRSGQEATLTAPALAVLPHARALISTSEAVVALVASGRGNVIRLGAVESASTFLLPQALASFRQRWPLVDVQVTIGLCDELRRRVQRGELDVAITVERPHGPPDRDGSGNGSRMLSPAELCLFVASPEATGGLDITRQDLVRCQVLLPDPDGALHALMREWLGKGSGRPRMESAGSIEGVKIGVRSGEFVGVLPRYAVARELDAGEFMRVQVDEPLPAIALGLPTQCVPLASSPLHAMTRCIEECAGALARPLPAGRLPAGRLPAGRKPAARSRQPAQRPTRS